MHHTDPERSFQTIAVFGSHTSGVTPTEQLGQTLALLSGASAYRIFPSLEECVSALSHAGEKDAPFLYAHSLGLERLDVGDTPVLAAAASDQRVPLVIDTTYTTPFMSRPLGCGADFVIQGLCPVISGHGEGSVVLLARDGEALPVVEGAGLSTLDDHASAVLTDIATLSLRLQRMNDLAHAVAAYLAASPHVEEVRYPGLDSSDRHQLARRMFAHGSGPLVSFDVIRGKEVEPFFSPDWNVVNPTNTLGQAIFMRTNVIQESTTDLVKFTLLLGLESIDDIVDDIEHAIRAVRSDA